MEWKRRDIGEGHSKEKEGKRGQKDSSGEEELEAENGLEEMSAKWTKQGNHISDCF